MTDESKSDSAAAGTPARQTHQHEYREFQVCWICGKTEAAIEGCHHCNDSDSVKNGRCWWCLKPLATGTPARQANDGFQELCQIDYCVNDKGLPHAKAQTCKLREDFRWLNAEIERGHYSLLRIVLAQRQGLVSNQIIREELLQLIQAAKVAAPVSGEGTGTLTRYHQPQIIKNGDVFDGFYYYKPAEVDATLAAKDAEIQLGLDRKQSVIARLGELENELQVERDAAANLADRLAAKDAQLAELTTCGQCGFVSNGDPDTCERCTLADLRRQGAKMVAELRVEASAGLGLAAMMEQGSPEHETTLAEVAVLKQCADNLSKMWRPLPDPSKETL